MEPRIRKAIPLAVLLAASSLVGCGSSGSGGGGAAATVTSSTDGGSGAASTTTLHPAKLADTPGSEAEHPDLAVGATSANVGPITFTRAADCRAAGTLTGPHGGVIDSVGRRYHAEDGIHPWTEFHFAAGVWSFVVSDPGSESHGGASAYPAPTPKTVVVATPLDKVANGLTADGRGGHVTGSLRDGGEQSTLDVTCACP